MSIKEITCFVIMLIVCRPGGSSYAQGVDVRTMNARLGRGINLGNALEAPVEGQWGVTLRQEYFQVIKDGGFDSVRIPIKWSAHASDTAPYTIAPSFFARVDWAVNNALSRGLVAVINIHHYDELMDDPSRVHQDRFLALWRQIAEHYKDYPDNLLFEPLNEPHGNLTYQMWNQLLEQVLSVIRRTNPNRNIVIGATGWNGKWDLVHRLQLPAQDRHIIATFHHYSPFEFTHQGAEWVSGSDAWLGTTWQGTPEQVRQITDDFDDVFEWSQTNDRPVYMGEFGAYSKADMPSRILWTSACAREAEARNFSWAYWEFCAGFGAYDDETGKWNDLHRALVPDAPAQNLVRNYEFDFGTDHWQERTQDEAAATITTTAGAGLSGTNALKVDIGDGGSRYDCVQAFQSNISLESGKSYRIDFMARADSRVPRTMQTKLRQQGNDRTAYWQSDQSLTVSPQTFSYLFNCATTDSKADLVFMLGANPTDVYIDKVILLEAWDCDKIIDLGFRLAGDISGADRVADCYVNIHDLAMVAQEWLKRFPTADMSGPDGVPDGVVSFHDFFVVAEDWLECNNLKDLRCDIGK